MPAPYYPGVQPPFGGELREILLRLDLIERKIDWIARRVAAPEPSAVAPVQPEQPEQPARPEQPKMPASETATERHEPAAAEPASANGVLNGFSTSSYFFAIAGEASFRSPIAPCRIWATSRSDGVNILGNRLKSRPLSSTNDSGTDMKENLRSLAIAPSVLTSSGVSSQHPMENNIVFSARIRAPSPDWRSALRTRGERGSVSLRNLDVKSMSSLQSFEHLYSPDSILWMAI